MPDSITSLLSLRQTLLCILLGFRSQDVKEPLLLPRLVDCFPDLTLNFPGWLTLEVFTGFHGKG